MGGVDLLDSFAAKYKFLMKSHRWYIYIFWHTIILAVINAWLLDKRDWKTNTSTQKGTSGSPVDPQKRPSTIDVSPPAKRSSDHPPLDVRKDMIAHIPVKMKRARCRHCNNGYTNILCSKRIVLQCFSDKNNCLRDYHCK
ncbi:piggyBac transposable element-derived protein 3-like [Tachysurus ichikawai]